jgi:hypothetical protein
LQIADQLKDGDYLYCDKPSLNITDSKHLEMNVTYQSVRLAAVAAGCFWVIGERY